MSIAIVGATSQIAKDLILSFAGSGQESLHLFARRPDAVRQWLAEVGLAARYPVSGYEAFADGEHAAVINFVGVGDPAQAVRMGSAVLEVTWQFDTMVLDYLQRHPSCRYLFLSSGAAYGHCFSEPVSEKSQAIIPLNTLTPQDLYGIAKLHAECRHRSQTASAIVDLRVFNYFSHTHDLSSRFFMADILRAIRDHTTLATSPDYIVRDFLHPSDFFQLVQAILAAPARNGVVDCYSRAPIDKPTLLTTMQEQFGLRYRVSEPRVAANATGVKPHYYSLNRAAAAWGYQPTLSSLEGILQESAKVLGRD